MFAELITSLWAYKERESHVFSSHQKRKSHEAKMQKSKPLRGLPSTLRHIFCLSKVSETVYHNVSQDASSLSPPQCPGIFPYLQACLPQELTSGQCVDL